MFTGLIREIGTVSEKKIDLNAATLKINAKLAPELNLGDSIAVNGVCLTVSARGPNWFKADVMPETIKSTNFQYLQTGEKVNLEPALRLGDHLGGHIVSGHVDCVGQVTEIKAESNAILFKIVFSKEFRKYIALKGSVAVNGVSLTIQKVFMDELAVSLIPHTVRETNFQFLNLRDRVNIEVDLLARYVVNMMERQSKNELTVDFLTENGFIR